jgi:8-oxo-dGTP pyrophosphatase MutT (NUDIX family)
MRQAAVALIEKNGLFLSVSRKNDSTKLGLPGGSCEKKETTAEAMVRELYEETGLIAREYEFLYKDYDGYDFETSCYLVSKYDGLAYSKETGVVKWVEKEKLLEPPFGWFNKKVFDKYLK